jgi:hypothetical protein
MSKPVVEVQVRAVAAVSEGCAVFLGNEDKVFVMFVDQSARTIALDERRRKIAPSLRKLDLFRLVLKARVR